MKSVNAYLINRLHAEHRHPNFFHLCLYLNPKNPSESKSGKTTFKRFDVPSFFTFILNQNKKNLCFN